LRGVSHTFLQGFFYTRPHKVSTQALFSWFQGKCNCLMYFFSMRIWFLRTTVVYFPGNIRSRRSQRITKHRHFWIVRR